MHAYKKKDANPQKGIDSQGISIEKTGYCRGNFRLSIWKISWRIHFARPAIPLPVHAFCLFRYTEINTRRVVLVRALAR
jgi:hypothetical protein